MFSRLWGRAMSTATAQNTAATIVTLHTHGNLSES
jgi:hypothetical protein